MFVGVALDANLSNKREIDGGEREAIIARRWPGGSEKAVAADRLR